jgi:hypothetical protein
VVEQRIPENIACVEFGHFFPVDEFYWENRPRYYAALDAVRREGEDLSEWLDGFPADSAQTALCHFSKWVTLSLYSPHRKPTNPRVYISKPAKEFFKCREARKMKGVYSAS